MGEERSSLEPKIESVSTTASTRGSFQLIVVDCINTGGRRVSIRTKGEGNLLKKCMHAAARADTMQRCKSKARILS